MKELRFEISFAVSPPVKDIPFNPDINSNHPLAWARYTNGMVWHYEDVDFSIMKADPLGVDTSGNPLPCRPPYVKHRINGSGTNPGQDLFTLQMSRKLSNVIDLARPSSAHVAGVNMAMADGGTRYVAETVDYRVYQALMTPRGKSSDVPFPEYVLTDEAFE